MKDLVIGLSLFGMVSACSPAPPITLHALINAMSFGLLTLS